MGHQHEWQSGRRMGRWRPQVPELVRQTDFQLRVPLAEPLSYIVGPEPPPGSWYPATPNPFANCLHYPMLLGHDDTD